MRWLLEMLFPRPVEPLGRNQVVRELLRRANTTTPPHPSLDSPWIRSSSPSARLRDGSGPTVGVFHGDHWGV